MVTFKFSFQPNVSEAQRSVFEMAGLVWSQFLDDDVTLNIHVATTDALPDNVLGGAVPGAYADQSYTVIQAALTADVTSSADQQAVDSLNRQGEDSFEALLETGGFRGDTVSLTRATAKALGLSEAADPSQLDGYIVLNDLGGSDFQWDFDYTRTGDALENSIDALSVAMHEIGHILGFTSGLDAVRQSSDEASAEENDVRLTDTSILDLFRYSDRSASSNQLDLAVGAASYFSIDGGRTSIAEFSTGLLDLGLGANGYQASHWATDRPIQGTPEDGSSGRFLFNSPFLGLTLFDNSLFQQSLSSSSVDNALLIAPLFESNQPSTVGADSISSNGDSIGSFLIPDVNVFPNISTSTEVVNVDPQVNVTSFGQTSEQAVGQMSNGSTVNSTTTLSTPQVIVTESPNTNIQGTVTSNPTVNLIQPESSPSAPLTDQQIEDLTARLESTDGLSSSVQLVTEPEDNPLGVMGPTLAPEERSNISWVDLAAFDAIGYDLTPLGTLFVDAQVASLETLPEDLVLGTPVPSNAEIFGISLNSLLGSESLQTQVDLAATAQVVTNTASHNIIDGMEAVSVMLAQSELYERRRRRIRKIRSSFFQEFEADLGTDLGGASVSVSAPTSAGENEDEAALNSDESAVPDEFQGLIQGQVRFDRDGDGDFRDGDGGLAGVAIRLFSDFDQDGQEDGVAIDTVETDELGQYEFGDLATGQYILVADDLDGFTSTADINGFAPNRIAYIKVAGNTIRNQDFLDTSTTSTGGQLASPVPSDPSISTVLEEPAIQIRSEGQNPSLTSPSISLSIQGQVRYDFDQDGDLGDPDIGIAGVQVELFADGDQNGKEDGGAIATAITDSNGQYRFETVAPGQYIVVAQDLDGLFSTADQNGFNPNRIAYLMVGGQSLTNQDFLDSSDQALSTLTNVFGIRSETNDFTGTIGNDELGRNNTDDRLFGAGGDDKLYGGGGQDLVVGGNGNDLVVGGAGNDRLQGNGGNDTVVGGAGRDILDGTDRQSLGLLEQDSLVGGDGADQFILGTSNSPYYVGGGGSDFVWINDFQPGTDEIVFHGTATDYSVKQRNGNTVIFYSPSQSSIDKPDVIAYLENLQLSDLNLPSIQYV